jgi:HlyD family secretion protein
VEVRVVVWQAPNVLRVPSSALFRVVEEWHVYVVGAGDVVEVRRVDVGRETGLEAEVRAGLNEGDRVVLYPSDRVSEGVWVVAR